MQMHSTKLGFVVVVGALLACGGQKATTEEKPAEKPPATPSEPAPAKPAASATAEPSAAAPIGGTYRITSASNPGGSGSYSGQVTITPGAVHTLKWTISDGSSYSGVGLAFDGALGVGWGLGEKYGVAVYTINGGKLSGRWATAVTAMGVGTEELEGPEGLDGSYTITAAKDPTGASYTGTVTIKPSGDVYSVKWTLPKESYEGVAIKQGSTLVVGWGVGGKGAGAVVYEASGANLNGKWAQPGGKALGTEVLAK